MRLWLEKSDPDLIATGRFSSHLPSHLLEQPAVEMHRPAEHAKMSIYLMNMICQWCVRSTWAQQASLVHETQHHGIQANSMNYTTFGHDNCTLACSVQGSQGASSCHKLHMISEAGMAHLAAQKPMILLKHLLAWGGQSLLPDMSSTYAVRASRCMLMQCAAAVQTVKLHVSALQRHER